MFIFYNTERLTAIGLSRPLRKPKEQWVKICSRDWWVGVTIVEFNDYHSLYMTVRDIFKFNGVFVLLICHLAEAAHRVGSCQYLEKDVFTLPHPIFILSSPTTKTRLLKTRIRAYLGY